MFHYRLRAKLQYHLCCVQFTVYSTSYDCVYEPGMSVYGAMAVYEHKVNIVSLLSYDCVYEDKGCQKMES